MRGAIPLGSLFGINIFLHWSFFLILIYVGYSRYSAGMDVAGISMELVFVLALFGCVVLHELGHALAARQYGIGTKRILLLPIGGVAQLERMPEKPGQELWVATAGPLVNVVIAILLLPVIYFTISADTIHYLQTAAIEEQLQFIFDSFLMRLLLANLILVAFNLIPAFPMDGGRMLRALLAFKFDYFRSTLIAARMGQLFALGFILLGFYASPFLILIGIFVIIGAEAEVRMVRMKQIHKMLKVADVLQDDIPLLFPYQKLKEAVKMILGGSGMNFLVINDNKEIEGLLTKDLISNAVTAEGNEAEISTIMATNFVTLKPKQTLDEAIKAMQDSHLPLLPVTDEDGIFVGAVELDTIIAVLSGAAKVEDKKV